MLRNKLTALLLALVLCTSLAFGGCYGSFHVTKKYHDWNGQVSNKWVNTLLFIIPGIIVYPLLTLGDTFIFNVIEFWSGKKVFAKAPQARAVADGSIEIDADGEVFKVVKVRDNYFDVTRNGQLVGHGQLRSDGMLELVDLSGERKTTIPVDQSAS